MTTTNSSSRASRLTYLGLALATMLAGLSLRFAFHGLAFWITKWGGSFLWAMMVYWIAALLSPMRRTSTLVLTTGLIVTGVELIRLYHAPGLDEFRRTLAGVLLLGRVFSLWDIATYWLAIVVTAGIDSLVFRSKEL